MRFTCELLPVLTVVTILPIMHTTKMEWKCSVGLLSLLIILSYLNVVSGAVAHSHSHKRSPSPGKERESDGAYSPRDLKHQDADGHHRSEFDHEAILGKK